MSLIYCHKCYGATQCVCETPADKSPPREFWIYQDKIDHDDIVSSIEPQYEKDIYTHVIEHSAYLAVKEKCAQLDDHNNRLIDESCKIIKERDKLQQELKAARAEIKNLEQDVTELSSKRLRQLADVREELENAKAQIKDYESALIKAKIYALNPDETVNHNEVAQVVDETLNKWKVK